MSWKGSFPEKGGTSTTTGMSLTLTGDPATSLNGSSQWTWSGPGTPSSCSGSSSITGTRTSTPTPPVAPSNLEATAGSNTSINLTWSDNSNDEAGFRVYRGTTSGTVTTLVTTLGAGTTTYTNTSLTAATTYYYKVTAYNSAGESVASNIDNATTGTPPVTPPVAPSNLVATAASSTSINLTWSDNSNDEAGFRVYRGTTSGTVTTLVTTLGAGTTTYTNTSLTALTTYYYKVTSYNSAGESVASNIANATTGTPPVTPPVAPSNLVATAASSTSINLTWSDNSNDESGFRVYRGTTSGTVTTLVTTLGAGTTTYTNTSLTAATTYYYKVTTYNSAGESVASNIANATTTTPTVQNITLYSAIDTTFVYSSDNAIMANTNFGRSNLMVGNAYYWGAFSSGYGRWAIALDFIIDQILNKTINSATLRMYINSRWPQYYYSNYRIFPVIASWNEYTVTWNNSVNIRSSPYTDPKIQTSDSYTEWDVTSIVRGWANGTIPTWGFFIKDMNEADIHGSTTIEQMTQFISRDPNNPQPYHPRLIIEYQ